MASQKLIFGVGAIVAIGFAVIIGAAVWSQYGHHDEMHDTMHGEEDMHSEDTDSHRGEGNEDSMPHDDATAGEHGHARTGEMGEHHDTDDHHEMDSEAVDMSTLTLTGTVQDGIRVIDMKARQFAFDPSTVVVKPGETVRLNVTSEDVTHGIDIEGFGIDKRLPPKETVAIEFTADKPGQHHFHCSVFCGKGHEEHGTLVVMEQTKAHSE